MAMAPPKAQEGGGHHVFCPPPPKLTNVLRISTLFRPNKFIFCKKKCKKFHQINVNVISIFLLKICGWIDPVGRPPHPTKQIHSFIWKHTIIWQHGCGERGKCVFCAGVAIVTQIVAVLLSAVNIIEMFMTEPWPIADKRFGSTSSLSGLGVIFGPCKLKSANTLLTYSFIYHQLLLVLILSLLISMPTFRLLIMVLFWVDDQIKNRALA